MIQLKTICLILCCSAGLLARHETAFGFQETKSADQTAALADANFDTWRNYIRAKESELVWQELPWETTYRDGLLRASADEKPLLLWVMNGHPMGCT